MDNQNINSLVLNSYHNSHENFTMWIVQNRQFEASEKLLIELSINNETDLLMLLVKHTCTKSVLDVLKLNAEFNNNDILCEFLSTI